MLIEKVHTSVLKAYGIGVLNKSFLKTKDYLAFLLFASLQSVYFDFRYVCFCRKRVRLIFIFCDCKASGEGCYTVANIGDPFFAFKFCETHSACGKNGRDKTERRSRGNVLSHPLRRADTCLPQIRTDPLVGVRIECE